jgi:hypothetical protein
MSDSPLGETRKCWNLLAADWRVQVGADGDSNRRLNSDPVLWEFAGDVRGLSVLDAGCGTGCIGFVGGHNVIRGNTVHGVRAARSGWGLYTDAGTNRELLEGSVV